MGDREINPVLAAVSEILSRMDKYERRLQYQQEIILGLQLDIQNLYRRAEGWPIENWDENEFGEDCIDNDCTG